MRDYKISYNILKSSLEEKGIDVNKAEKRLKTLKIETPSWGYADSDKKMLLKR
jgi:L-rhamnose isomerase/sugar isomerase